MKTFETLKNDLDLQQPFMKVENKLINHTYKESG